MYYYKFRVNFDEIDDFIRDIEILSHDTFASFHHILYDSIGLKNNELASFFICDSKWNKQKEITLIDMNFDQKEEIPTYNDDDEYSMKSTAIPKIIMEKAVLKDFIADPHQKIIYEYDFLNPKVFYIELLKVLQTNSETGFPRCTFKAKEIPQQLTNSAIPNPEEDSSFETFDDAEDFEDGYNEEDTFDLGIENFEMDY